MKEYTVNLTKNVDLFLDLHGHHAKTHAFFYGCLPVSAASKTQAKKGILGQPPGVGPANISNTAVVLHTAKNNGSVSSELFVKHAIFPVLASLASSDFSLTQLNRNCLKSKIPGAHGM